MVNAYLAGLFASAVVIALIYFGSGRLTRFDTALAAYAAATVFAAFAIAYRYTMWIQRPPTLHYFRAGWKLFLRPSRLLPNLLRLVGLVLSHIVAQRFISRRSRSRWIAHLTLAWGCLLAFAITIPLSWGWIVFAPEGDRYAIEMMGQRVMTFEPDSTLGFFIFNGLNLSAVLVLIGVGISMHRRLNDRGAAAVQRFDNDLVPLILLFAVSITGLMLTASYKLMSGENYGFLSLVHAFTVVLLLLYLPFGKLFHVIQRPAQLGVAYYKVECERGERAVCLRSGAEYQSKLHHDDLKKVMNDVGFDFGEHQDLSPQEKRRLIALSQSELLDESNYAG